MLNGDTRRLESHVKAIGRRQRGDNCQRRLAVAPVKSLVKVGLFGLGRQTRRRAAALHVDYH